MSIDSIKKRNNFPKSFLWGASVSSHQVEGGNHNQWSVWELETAKIKSTEASSTFSHVPVWNEVKSQAGKPQNYVSGRAANHYNLYESDFDLAKELNLNSVRVGIEWSRIEPQAGEFNEDAIVHYRNYIEAIIKRDMVPVVTFWHWTMPVWFSEKGGFAKSSNIKYFVKYIETLTERMGDLMTYIITINEPTVYASMSYHEGRWPPQMYSKIMLIKVLKNLATAHKQSYRIIKKRYPNIRVGLAHNCAYYYTKDSSIISRIATRLGHYAGNELFINRIDRYQDFFGLNYYFSHRILKINTNKFHDQINDLGWGMEPGNLKPLLSLLYKKYRKPIIITENGLADMHDNYRKWWLEKTIEAMNYAIGEGVELAGYMHWSLLDNFEWAEGFWPRFGLIDVNYDTQKRTIRASAHWFAGVIKSLAKK